MSTKAIHEALRCLKEEGGWDETVREATEEAEAIEKAAVALVDWNKKGRPAFHLDAARGYDLLERIAKETKT